MYPAVIQTLKSYGPDYPLLIGPNVPAYSRLAMSILSQSTLICFGTLALSIILALIGLRRAKTSADKSYWLLLLSNLNYYVAFLLLNMLLVGFFMLPKLANGT
jgi:hypothetical protein